MTSMVGWQMTQPRYNKRLPKDASVSHGDLIAKLLGVSRAEAICGVANIFLGQSEAPLLFRPIAPLLNASAAEEKLSVLDAAYWRRFLGELKALV